jgi:tetratricopeptide (TPR) repeat protein
LARKAPYLAECGDWSDELFGEILAEMENVRAAWRWAAAHGDLEVLGEAQDGLCKFYQRQSWFQEGSEAFAFAVARLEALAAAEGGERYLPLLAALVTRRGMFAAYLGQHDLARQLLQQGLDLLHAHGDQKELAQALMRAGVVLREFGDSAEARRLLEQTLAVSRAAGDEELTTHTLSYLGYLLGETGEFAAAFAVLDEALTRARLAGDPKVLASALNNHGFVCYLAGDLDRALALMEESLALRRELGNGYGLAIALDNLGYIRAARGETAAATGLFGETLTMARERHAVPLANDAILGLAMLLPLPDQAPRAVELMTFVMQHPLTWRETRDRAARWVAERACLLAPEGVAAAQARAHASTYEEVVETLLPLAV